MNQLRRRNAKSTPPRGRTVFVLKYGVLGWGLTTGILWSLLMSWSDGFRSFYTLLLPAMVLFPTGGYFFGRMLWAFQDCLQPKSTPPTGN